LVNGMEVLSTRRRRSGGEGVGGFMENIKEYVEAPQETVESTSTLLPTNQPEPLRKVPSSGEERKWGDYKVQQLRGDQAALSIGRELPEDTMLIINKDLYFTKPQVVLMLGFVFVAYLVGKLT